MSMLPCLKEIKCGVGRTKQKVGVEHDINKLVARYQKTGDVCVLGLDHQGQFIDVATVGDYHDCQNRVLAAQSAFSALPSLVRKRFGNSCDAFMDFMSNLGPDSVDEAVKLGLVTKKDVPVATPATANNSDPEVKK